MGYARLGRRHFHRGRVLLAISACPTLTDKFITLVVSDVSRHGIVMVGESAVTGRSGVSSGAVKIQYSPAANVGFAIWGDAVTGGVDMDRWLADFIRTEVRAGDTVEAVGNKLVAALNPILSASGRSWAEMRRGIHIAGYRDGLPVLFHAHGGHEGEAAHEIQLYHDYPDDQHWSEQQYREILNEPLSFVHLRNGYYRHFGPLFASMAAVFSPMIKEVLNVDFPYGTLEGRLAFYKTLIRFIANVLVAAQEDPGVNDQLSAIAFNAAGIVKNEMLDFPETRILPSTYGNF